MEWREESRASYLGTLRSPWALLLAVALAVGPVALGIQVFGGEPRFDGDPLEMATRLVSGVAGYPSMFVGIVLVVMLGAGAFAPGANAMSALLGRTGALLTLAALAWGLPMAIVVASTLGGGALPAVALALGVTALEVVALVTLFSLFAEFGAGRAAVLGAALLLFSMEVLPLANYALLPLLGERLSDGGFALWSARLAFLSPLAAADQLTATLFPQSMLFVDEQVRLDHALLFSPWLWAAVMFAWTIIPLGILRSATSGAPPEDEGVQAA